MKRTLILAIIILFLLLTIPGCTRGSGSETPVASPENSAPASTSTENENTTPTPTVERQGPVPTVEQKQPSLTVDQQPPLDFTYDEASCTPWQLAYVDLLQGIFSRETPVRSAHSEGRFEEAEDLLSERYCLYDVDKDEVPEIFIRFGDCEANYYTESYTFKNKSTVLVGAYHSGHSCLYTWPGENAVLYFGGHMGYAEMDKLSIVDGELTFENIFTEDISNNPEADYTQPDIIVPGAIYLAEFRTILNLPQYTPLTLPVYDCCKIASQKEGTITEGDADHKAIAEVLAGTRKLYGVSADGFGGDTGWISFKDYCESGATDLSLKIEKYGWADFNQDGGEECILLLGDKTESMSDMYVILSMQDGIVYAYCINYSGDEEVYQDGVFISQYNSYGISFYNNQCYQYTKMHAPSSPPISWES